MNWNRMYLSSRFLFLPWQILTSKEVLPDRGRVRWEQEHVTDDFRNIASEERKGSTAASFFRCAQSLVRTKKNAEPLDSPESIKDTCISLFWTARSRSASWAWDCFKSRFIQCYVPHTGTAGVEWGTSLLLVQFKVVNRSYSKGLRLGSGFDRHFWISGPKISPRDFWPIFMQKSGSQSLVGTQFGKFGPLPCTWTHSGIGVFVLVVPSWIPKASLMRWREGCCSELFIQVILSIDIRNPRNGHWIKFLTSSAN